MKFNMNALTCVVVDRGLATSKDDVRSITDLLVSQVEFANILVLNKCDLVSAEMLKRLHKVLRALNTDAKIIESVYSKIGLNYIKYYV